MMSSPLPAVHSDEPEVSLLLALMMASTIEQPSPLLIPIAPAVTTIVAGGAAETFAGLAISNSKQLRLTQSTPLRKCCEEGRWRSEKERLGIIGYPLYQHRQEWQQRQEQR